MIAVAALHLALDAGSIAMPKDWWLVFDVHWDELDVCLGWFAWSQRQDVLDMIQGILALPPHKPLLISWRPRLDCESLASFIYGE